jgi:thiol-disulfide isomerase/thioredoxin
MDSSRSPFLRLFCAGCLLAGAAVASGRVPAPAQSNLAENLDGKLTDPFKAAEGQVVVLLFVRTDCPISNRYAPTIQKINEKFSGKAKLWLVYPDADESAARIRAHVEEFYYAIPALRDMHHTLVKRAQAEIIPEAAVFDGSGKLLYHGRIDNWYEDFGRPRATPTTHELEDAIRNALDGKASVPAHVSAVGCYIADIK